MGRYKTGIKAVGGAGRADRDHAWNGSAYAVMNKKDRVLHPGFSLRQ